MRVFEGPRILLVDDDGQVLKFMKKALDDAGFSVTATTSGTEALMLIEQRVPDLMILDLNMPAPDGFDLLKRARATHPYLRILVISGYLHGSLLRAAKIVGAFATLEKPVSAETLVAKTREILGM